MGINNQSNIIHYLKFNNSDLEKNQNIELSVFQENNGINLSVNLKGVFSNVSWLTGGYSDVYWLNRNCSGVCSHSKHYWAISWWNGNCSDVCFDWKKKQFGVS